MDRAFKLVVVLDEQQGNKGNWTPLHQCLLMLLDSPLNHAALLEVFIRLTDQRVIKLHREVRIPRTFKRFEQLFCNFLQGCDMPVVQTRDGPVRLFQIVKTLHHSGGAKFRITNLTSRMRDASYFAESVETLKQAVIFIDFGPVDYNFLGNGREVEYDIKFIEKKPAPETYSISHYPLPPSLICVKITTAFERALDIF